MPIAEILTMPGAIFVIPAVVVFVPLGIYVIAGVCWMVIRGKR